MDLDQYASAHGRRTAPPVDVRVAAMQEASARGRYDDALRIARQVLRERPGDVTCLSTIEDCGKALEELHVFSLAARFRVPVLSRSMSEIMTLPLDHRAGFLLSLIEAGTCNVDDLLAISPMPAHEALEILFGLVRAGAVELR